MKIPIWICIAQSLTLGLTTVRCIALSESSVNEAGGMEKKVSLGWQDSIDLQGNQLKITQRTARQAVRSWM